MVLARNIYSVLNVPETLLDSVIIEGSGSSRL